MTINDVEIIMEHHYDAHPVGDWLNTWSYETLGYDSPSAPVIARGKFLDAKGHLHLVVTDPMVENDFEGFDVFKFEQRFED